MQELNQLVTRLSGPFRTRILTREEEREAAISWQTNRDESARLLIIQSHAKFVGTQVRRMRHYKANPADLFSEGLIGLTIALDKFDPDAGFRFSTYALHWVRSKLNDHLLQTEGIMRLSNSEKQRRMLFGYRKAMAEFSKKAHNDGQNLSREELQEKVADRLSVSVEDIRQFSAAMSNGTPLQAPMASSSDGDSQTLADILPDGGPTAEEILSEHQRTSLMQFNIAAAMKKLNPREQNIILTRKLAPSGEVKTLEELAQIYNVSRERIRQIEVVALKKLEKTLLPTRKLLEAA